MRFPPFYHLVVATGMAAAASQAQETHSRRAVRAALYPFVPDKPGIYWKLEQEFEAANPEIDLQFVDLSGDYYSGGLKKALGVDSPDMPDSEKVDVVEVDTVFLHDLVAKNALQPLPSEIEPAKADYLPLATAASSLNGTSYGVPHWVCGNFMFFRADDPEAARLSNVKTLDDLERVIGRPSNEKGALLIDLQGSSTLGEKYFDAVLDLTGDPEKALSFTTNTGTVSQEPKQALNRLFKLTPGGLCDSEYHHDFGQFYPRQFARRNARVFIGYSEQLYYVVDETLHGIEDSQPAVGRIWFGDEVTSSNDIRVTTATFSDKGSRPLGWVDILSLRTGLSDSKKQDAIKVIQFLNSEKFTLSILNPQWGEAPRYLLPARTSIYDDAKLRLAAPLYPAFREIMKEAVAITGPGLNENLRAIGKEIRQKGLKSD